MPKLLLKGNRTTKRVYTLEDGEQLTLHFKYLTYLDKTDVTAMILSKDSVKNAFKCIVGWEGVVGENDKPIPFTHDNLDLLLTQYENDAEKILADVQEFCGWGEKPDPNLQPPLESS